MQNKDITAIFTSFFVILIITFACGFFIGFFGGRNNYIKDISQKKIESTILIKDYIPEKIVNELGPEYELSFYDTNDHIAYIKQNKDVLTDNIILQINYENNTNNIVGAYIYILNEINTGTDEEIKEIIRVISRCSDEEAKEIYDTLISNIKINRLYTTSSSTECDFSIKKFDTDKSKVIIESLNKNVNKQDFVKYSEDIKMIIISNGNSEANLLKYFRE